MIWTENRAEIGVVLARPAAHSGNLDTHGTQQTQHFPSGRITDRTYAARIFGLPKTHSITHAAPDSVDHVEFHVWGLSFFTGMRLTTTEAGFVDATPIKPGKLVDFVLLNRLEN